MDLTSENDITKDRLLNAAEVLFAQKGYRGASVREIIKSANCNLAAVNYHFGSKRNLYLEVFRSRWLPRAKRLRESITKAVAAEDSPSLAVVVKALAKGFLEGPITDKERKRHALLIIRELAEPTEAFDLVAEVALEPLFKELADHVRPVMPQGLDEKQLRLNIFSIFAMVIYFNFARTAVTHITGQKYDLDFKEMLVEHITKFSLKGLSASQEEELR